MARNSSDSGNEHVLLLMENGRSGSLQEGTAFVCIVWVQCYEQALQPQSEKLCQEALGLYRNLAVSCPSEYEPYVAMTCNDLAVLLSDSTERREEAEGQFWVPGAVSEVIGGQPGVYEPYVAGTCNNLAALLSDSTEGRGEAEKLYWKSLKLYQKLSEANPSVYEQNVAMECNNLATFLADSLERRGKAEKLYRKALKLRRNLAKVNPSLYEPDVPVTCNNLA
ncbi:MAG: tetratricopeptide repeat protein [Oscillospiraceae bacterium]